MAIARRFRLQVLMFPFELMLEHDQNRPGIFAVTIFLVELGELGNEAM
jgi:hypothetical protein